MIHAVTVWYLDALMDYAYTKQTAYQPGYDEQTATNICVCCHYGITSARRAQSQARAILAYYGSPQGPLHDYMERLPPAPLKVRNGDDEGT